MDHNNIIEIVTVMITFVFGITIRYFIPYIKSKSESSKLDTLLVWVKEAVLAAEQIYSKEKSGTVKKNYVKKRIGEIANKSGIKLTCSEVEILLEAVVKQMKDGDIVKSPEE